MPSLDVFHSDGWVISIGSCPHLSRGQRVCANPLKGRRACTSLRDIPRALSRGVVHQPFLTLMNVVGASTAFVNSRITPSTSSGGGLALSRIIASCTSSVILKGGNPVLASCVGVESGLFAIPIILRLIMPSSHVSEDRRRCPFWKSRLSMLSSARPRQLVSFQSNCSDQHTTSWVVASFHEV